ncbi:MAG: DinB family protein [Jatrophihabitantaceae bacterium]
MTEDTALLPMLLTGLDDAWNRLHGRLAGLSQAEYRWSPVAGCWDVREGPDGWTVEGAREDPEPAPVTTIAWRMWHLAADCLSNYVSPELGDWPLQVTGSQWHGDVDTAQAELATAYRTFRARLDGLGEDGLRAKLGPDWGSYAEQNWADLAVHALDELAHHGGEIGLLRDLYLRLGCPQG